MSAYTSLEALLHDAFWAAEGEPAELPLLDEMLREHPGRALEIGCGSGRLLLPLLQKGHTVEGLELSAEMLDLCRASAAGLGLSPVLHEADMTVWSPPSPYHALLLPAFTFQLFGDAVAALAALHGMLEKDGLLYLSVFVPLAELHRELPENAWYDDHRTTLPDGRSATVRTRHQLDRRQRILTREHRYELLSPEGDALGTHESRQELRWFTPRQLGGMLDRGGFDPIHAIADFDPELPVNEDAQIVTVIARRR